MGRKRSPSAFAQLDVRQMKRDGHLPADATGLMVSTDEAEPVHIGLTWTRQPLGGKRPWFVCNGCRRPAAILYGSPFYCRRCWRIGYPSQKRTPLRRLQDKYFALRGRVGEPQEPGDCMFEPFPPRPPGMHRKRYRRLREDYRATSEAYDAAMNWSLMRVWQKLALRGP